MTGAHKNNINKMSAASTSVRTFATFGEIEPVRSIRVFVVQFLHMKPTTSEAAVYFADFGNVLNDRATPEAPCAIVFDTSLIKLSDGMPLKFFKRHHDFNVAFVGRIVSVCTSMGLVLPASLSALRPLITAALFAMPKNAQKLQDFKTVEDAVRELAGK
jgi:hypothetical protein